MELRFRRGYPVLGPDDFLVSALKEQVLKHRDKHRRLSGELEATEVIQAVFEALSIDPSMALKRVKPSNVSRTREGAFCLDMGGATGAVAGDDSGCHGRPADRGERDAVEAEAGGVEE
jgi:hypothetical protein